MSEYVLNIGEKEYRAEVEELTGDRARIVVNGKEYGVTLVQIGRRRIVAPATVRGSTTYVVAPAPAPAAAPVTVSSAAPAPTAAPAPAPAKAAPAPAPRHPGAGVGRSGVVAPLPGLILQVSVQPGDQVQAGQKIVVMEAMKMENPIPAPHNGTVKKIYVSPGDNVGEGYVLMEISPPEMTSV